MVFIMAARMLGPVIALAATLVALGAGASPAAAFSVGQACTGNFNGVNTSTVKCTGQGTPSQDVWVTVSNVGSVPFEMVSCGTSSCTSPGQGSVGTDEAAPGTSSFLPLPAGETLGLKTVYVKPGDPGAGSVAAQITGVYPQSSPPALAVGQVCSGGNFVPTNVQCIWTNQFGAVTQNSWVTFSNTGPLTVTMVFDGLHGSRDTQKLQPGQLAYVGIGAGHSTGGSQLELGQPTSDSGDTPPVPPNPPGQVTIHSLVAENMSGFSLASGQTCTTASYVVNPVACAPSGQIGQGSSSGNVTVTFTNTGAGNTALVGNDNGGGGLLTIGPGQSATTSFDKNAQLLLTCLAGSSQSDCSAAANATIKVDSVTTAANAATLASPTQTTPGRRDLSAKLRCAASNRARCQGMVTLRAGSHGRILARASYRVRAGGHGTLKLLPGATLTSGALVLTITTRQPNGQLLITDQRKLTLKR